MFENVKGLLKTNKHRLFYELLKHKLKRFGYILTERLINSLEYGVPQDRDRIILIGFHSKLIIDMGISLSKFTFPWEKYSVYTKENVFAYPWVRCETFQENSISPFPNNIPRELTVEFWFDKNNVLHHPNAKHYFKPRAGIKNLLRSMKEIIPKII